MESVWRLSVRWNSGRSRRNSVALHRARRQVGGASTFCRASPPVGGVRWDSIPTLTAALAEGRWGAAQALSDFAYVTVGTGVGVGVVANGSLLGGCNHPELGHIRVGRMAGDSWPGCCAFHGDCVEGLASGPAISARAGRPADEVEADSPVWMPVADALGRLLHALVFTTMPRRILIGGGVATARPELLALVRQRLLASINNYIDIEDLVGSVDQFVVAAGLGESAGPLGALALAGDAASRALRELSGSV